MPNDQEELNAQESIKSADDFNANAVLEEKRRLQELDESLGEGEKAIRKKITQTSDALRSLSGVESNLRNDGEASTAFFIIFSDITSIFTNEINRIKRTALKEKIELYEEIKDEYVKNGALTKEMLKKTELAEKQKDVLVQFSDDISKIMEEGGLKDSPIFNEILKSSNSILKTAMETNIKTLTSGGLINALEENTKDVVKDKLVDKTKETLKDVEREVVRSRSKVKAR